MATAVKPLTVQEQIQQLGEARKIVLENPAYYDRIVQGILPIIGPSSPVELRRWGADFLAESLATPALPPSEKESLTVSILGTLRDLVESQNEDTLVLKSSVIAAATAYPLIFRWTILNADGDEKRVTETWQLLTAIKSRVLRIWENAANPVKVCCIKFAQRVVLAQTVSNGLDHKLSGLDISLSMIPPNHPFLDLRNLEAEATGLLDRMLGVLQDNISDALLVDATLNALSILIRGRPGTSNRIVSAVMNFNPMKLAMVPLTPRTKVLIKSMEKTTRLLLMHLAKRDPNNPMAGRLHQQAERLLRLRREAFEESRKRALPESTANNNGDMKRQRIEAEVQPNFKVLESRTWAPGPQTLANVFTLTDTRELAAFNATLVPSHLAAKISTATLASVDTRLLEQALDAVRGRLFKLYEGGQAAPLNPDTAPLGIDDDDDEYEPDFYVAEDTEQILNKLDSSPAERLEAPADDAATALATLGSFKLPCPSRLDSEALARTRQVLLSRLFEPLDTLDDSVVRRSKAGLNRLAASSHGKDSWLTLIIRLATRGSSGLEATNSMIKAEDTSTSLHQPSSSFPDSIREMIFSYILQDFRRRIDYAVAWLCEEWYCDRVRRRRGLDGPRNYETWSLRLMDGFFDYLTPQDKVLTRFLAEIPELNRDLMGRVKSLCSDPTRVSLALTSLLYLVMMKPPARDLALDTVAEIWQEVETARPLASKYLTKWRPGFIESQKTKVEDVDMKALPVATAG